MCEVKKDYKEGGYIHMIEGKDFDIPFMAMDEEACRVINRMFSAAKTKKSNIKQSMPSIFLTAEHGSGITSFGKTCAYILEKNRVFPVRGKNCFLELTFPGSNSEEIIFRKFFSSSRTATSTQNRFYGAFLIHFDEYENGRELVQSKGFEQLLSFIQENKDNIFFIFCFSDRFPGETMIYQELISNTNINLVKVHLQYPNADSSLSYIQNQLEEDDFWLDKEAKEEFKLFVQELIDNNSFCGYQTLEKLVKSLRFELAQARFGKVYENETKRMIVSADKIRNVKESFLIQKISTERKIGFAM